MAKERIKKILVAVSGALGDMKASFRRGQSGRGLFAAFASALGRRINYEDIKFDLLIGKDTVGIDGFSAEAVPTDGDAVLFDLSVKAGGEWCDVARTYFVGGLSERQKAAYDLVRRSVEAGAAALSAGAAAGSVYDAVNAVYLAEGKTLVHHAGHRIGEEPLMQPQFLAGRGETLFAGEIVTVESGLYDGFGIRLENDYYITDGGAEDLFSDLMPSDPEEYIL